MNEQIYKEGQIFEGTYPPEAAIWCNENGMHFELLDGNTTKYIIVKNIEVVPSNEMLLRQKEFEYGMTRWQREGILAEDSPYSDFVKERAQELEDLANSIREEN